MKMAAKIVFWGISCVWSVCSFASCPLPSEINISKEGKITTTNRNFWVYTLNQKPVSPGKISLVQVTVVNRRAAPNSPSPFISPTCVYSVNGVQFKLNGYPTGAPDEWSENGPTYQCDTNGSATKCNFY